MELQKIDLTGIIRSRLKGWKGKLVPGFLLNGLEKLIRQKELNGILEAVYPAEGSQFGRRVYNHLGIRIETDGLERLTSNRRYVFASNHPLGGLDGIGLIMLLGEKYGDGNVMFIVNDMLMNIHPLRSVFLPVNKYGSQARESAQRLNEAFRSDKQIAIFPAGLVSRLHPDGGIRDLEWQKSFVIKAIESGRDIVPVRFEALNRKRFYRLAYIRKKMRIGINLEQALLPAELVAAQGKSYKVYFGTPVNPVKLKEDGLSIPEIISHIRTLSDNLQPTQKQ